MKATAFLFALMFFVAMPAWAETQIYTPQSGDKLRKLPGNAYVITNPETDPGVVILNDDESILYRALFGKYKTNPRYLDSAAPITDVNRFCGNAESTTEKNKCIRDVIKARQKLNKRYND